MQDQWQKYSIKGWTFSGSHEISYLPDHFMEMMLDTLDPYIKAAVKLPPQYAPFNAPDTLAYTASMETALKETQATISSFSSRFDNAVKEANEKGYLHLTPSEVGWGKGFCSDENLVWEFDHSINNVIYFAHEFGHRIGNTGSNVLPPWNITEWQSNFVHLTQIDRLINQQTMGSDAANVAYQHRHLEMVLYLRNLDIGTNALKRLRTEESIPEKERDHLTDRAKSIHEKSTAMFVGLALYERFKTADMPTREKMLDALYNQGRDATPRNIITAFGFSNISELSVAITRALETIEFDPGRNISPSPQILKNI